MRDAPDSPLGVPVDLDGWAALLAGSLPGQRLTAIQPIAGGTTNHVVRITVEGPGGRGHLVVRWRREPAGGQRQGLSTMAYEFRLLSALTVRGIPVPRPVALVDAGGMLAGPYLVTEFVAGTSAPATPSVLSAMSQAAKVMASLHEIDVGAQDLNFLASADGPGEDGRDGNSVCLVHNDFWPGNLLWRDGHLAAVVDWEDAGRGSPLLDLANARLEMWLAHGRAAAERFTTTYLRERPHVVIDSLPRREVLLAESVRRKLPQWAGSPDRLLSMMRALEAFSEEARRHR